MTPIDFARIKKLIRDSLSGSGAVQGAQGPKGDKGDPGEQGPKGDPGSSPYQIAKQGGYSGIESEYNDILMNLGDIPKGLSEIIGE